MALTGTLFLGGSAAPHETLAVTSGSASNSNTSTVDNGMFFIFDPITPHDEQVLSRSVQYAKSFWNKRLHNLAGIAATKLAILKGDDEFNCPDKHGKPAYILASDVNGSGYCQKLGTIVITEGLVNYIHEKTENSDPALEFFAGHEYGHAIQAARGTLQPGEVTTPAMEQQADCYAGVVSKALDPAGIPDIESFLPLLPTDDRRHGTPQQRAFSFKRGVVNGSC